MLKGRLGLDTARIPQRDRHGVLWLIRGQLAVRNGTLHFTTAGADGLEAGDYDIAFQMLNCIVLGPGCTVSHDALRLLARHGTGLVASGTDGVRHYASMPFGPDTSSLARRHVRVWHDDEQRIRVVRRMYAWRLGEEFPLAGLNELRGMEGSRSRVLYRAMAKTHGVTWTGRRYDRQAPSGNDPVNNAINHASVATVAAAQVATAIVGAIPQLGFIHEDSGISFCLDVADMYRESVTLDCAFAAAAEYSRRGGDLERMTRQAVGRRLRKDQVVAGMIDRIKELLHADDAGDHA